MAAEPTYASPLPPDVDIAAPLLGAQMLGLPLFEQGERIAALLEARTPDDAALFPTCVVQVGRRATKTTSILATCIGRAATREGYRAVVTAQTGTTASRILLEHANLLLQNGYAVESRERTAADTTGKAILFRSGGREALEFPDTGSRIWVVPPDPGAVRSQASDDIVIDEAGEHDVVKGREFLRAVRPLMMTRGDRAQLIVTGTPGKVRAGFYWDLLERGRSGTDPDLGIIDYSVRDDEDIEDREVWGRVHPGPSSILPNGRALTPMDVLEREWRELGPAAFAREILCRWPNDGNTSAIDLEAWRAAQVPVQPRPERFGCAFDIAPDGSSAALAVAWRDAEGLAYIGLIDHRDGTRWVARAAHSLATRYRIPIRYDAIGANHAIAAELERLGRVRLVPGSMKDAVGAVQTVTEALRSGDLRHFGQTSLDAAAEGAAFRESEGGRLWGRRASAADVTPLVAAGLALWQADVDSKARGTRTIRSTMSA